MRRVFLAIIAIGVFVVPAAGMAGQDKDLVAKGEKLYAANKCVTCHSVADKGNKKGPLDEVGSKLTAEELRRWLTHPAEMAAKANATRKPAMKPYDKLSAQELDALVAYMQTLKKK
jgi:mono/diheme cytochrome c family protein